YEFFADILPVGNSHIPVMRKLPVVLLCRTISILQKSANQKYSPAIPPRHEGRYGQSSRNVRRGCDGRVDAGRRAASCVRRSRVVPTPRCWCQAPGMIPGVTVTKKARYAEESTE